MDFVCTHWSAIVRTLGVLQLHLRSEFSLYLFDHKTCDSLLLRFSWARTDCEGDKEKQDGHDNSFSQFRQHVLPVSELPHRSEAVLSS